MAAMPLPKRLFYVQWYDADVCEWRFRLSNGEYMSFTYYPIAEDWQRMIADQHRGCVTRIVDQTGAVYGIPLVIVEAVR